MGGKKGRKENQGKKNYEHRELFKSFLKRNAKVLEL
jgi:hypothetical protein